MNTLRPNGPGQSIVSAAAIGASQAVERMRNRPLAQWNLASNELVHRRATQLIERALRVLPAEAVIKYPDYAETGGLLAGYLGVRDTQLALAPGSDAAIQHICEQFGRLAECIMSLSPNYAGWDLYSRLYRLPIVHIGDPADTTRAGLDKLLTQMSSTARRVVAVATPDPVWGRTLSEPDLAELRSAALGKGHLLVVDECYRFFRRDRPETVDSRSGEVHLVSLSKGFGLAGARLAAVIGDADALEVLRRDRLEGGVSGVTLALLRELLPLANSDWKDIWSDIMFQRSHIAASVSEATPEWNVVAGSGNFVTFLATKPKSHQAMLRRADRLGVRVRDLTALGVPRGIRTTVGDSSVSAEIMALLAL